MSARQPILVTVGVPFEAEPLSAEHQRELDIIRERELGNLREELTALCTHMEYLRKRDAIAVIDMSVELIALNQTDSGRNCPTTFHGSMSPTLLIG